MSDTFTRTLLDLCTVYRAVRDYDADGQPVLGVFTAVAGMVDLRCRLMKYQKFVYNTETARGAWIERYRVDVLGTPSVLKEDQVEVDAVRYAIASVTPRREHHMTIELERLGG